MRLLLLAFIIVAFYQCASPQGKSKTIDMIKGMSITQYNGKTVKEIKVVGNNNLIFSFTDGSIMVIESYKYNMKWVQ